MPAVDAVFTLTNTRTQVEIVDADTRQDSLGVLIDVAVPALRHTVPPER